VFILNGLKVACFHTLLQVFILKVVSGTGWAVVHKVKEQDEERSLERDGGQWQSPERRFDFGIFGGASRWRGMAFNEMSIANG
jgi:hypothetical protein